MVELKQPAVTCDLIVSNTQNLSYYISFNNTKRTHNQHLVESGQGVISIHHLKSTGTLKQQLCQPTRCVCGNNKQMCYMKNSSHLQS